MNAPFAFAPLSVAARARITAPIAPSIMRKRLELCALLAELSPADRLDVLGELLEPSQAGPFDHGRYDDEALLEAQAPVTAAYIKAYPALTRAVRDTM